MHNFLIVDDEEFICDSLCQIFASQTHLELEISRAYSASQALELLNRQRFDVVMTDIEMPGMSGIELMREINSRWIDCRIIFLTAHSRFEYIYTTRQYKNTKYLLKTEKIDTIIRTVQETIEELERDRFNVELQRRTNSAGYVNHDLYLRYVVADILQGNPVADRMGTSDSREIFPIRPEEPVFLIIGALDRGGVRNIPFENARLYEGILAEVERNLSGSCACVGAFLESEFLVWLVQPCEFSQYVEKDGINRVCFSLINGNLPVIQDIIVRSLRVSPCFVVCSEPQPLNSLCETYRAMKQFYFYQHGVCDGEILLYLPDENVQRYARKDEWTQRQIRTGELENLIREGNAEIIGEYMRSVLSVPAGAQPEPYLYYELYAAISLEVLSILCRYQLTKQVDERLPVEKLVSYNSHASWKAAVEYLTQVAVLSSQLRGKYLENATGKIIHEVNEYINAHLDDDLSLSRLADLFHYNPAYFSRVYKDTTGENIKRYISGARLERAKLLLKDTNLRITEVAQQVGFDHPANFGRFFKDGTGITPQTYRESWGSAAAGV